MNNHQTARNYISYYVKDLGLVGGVTGELDNGNIDPNYLHAQFLLFCIYIFCDDRRIFNTPILNWSLKIKFGCVLIVYCYCLWGWLSGSNQYAYIKFESDSFCELVFLLFKGRVA